jgi:serine/threonine protein phosphatase PrpC/predicted Ser/Thr protein kinase
MSTLRQNAPSAERAPSRLMVAVGQCSDRGRKAVNQDFHGAYVPDEPQLTSKGVAITLADGISSSEVSHIASEVAVTGFLADYFCTPETWSVRKSVQRVLTATNSWLQAHTQRSQYRHDQDRGYVCTLSALVIKSTTAHLFHVGDSRIYRLRGGTVEQLTEDHRVRLSREISYLSRALGINPHLEIDYRTLPVEQGDVFLLATDGVYEHIAAGSIINAIEAHPDDLDAAAGQLLAEAYAAGSSDNLTVQLVRIDGLSQPEAGEFFRQLTELPLPPVLQARMHFDGYRIVRELHASARSHVYLAADEDDGSVVVLKTPSIDLSRDPAYLERFLTEEWIARRINSPHVLKPCRPTRKRNYLYTVMEFVDGQTLAQWMIDNPRPSLETVRGIIEQIAAGLRAFHRLEMLHQDLRPANVMIDRTGTVKIIDFGAARVAGLAELASPAQHDHLLGTAQYAAPEYFLGETGSARSDLFSLGVIAYQMLTGGLPYGAEVAKCRSRAAQHKLKYRTALADDRELPTWIDPVLRKATHPDPRRRYAELSEFLFDLRHPNDELAEAPRAPLIERNPVLFWQCVSLLLAALIVALLAGQ